MNTNPVPRNEAHGVALENYRVAQVTLNRYCCGVLSFRSPYTNHENVINGHGIAYLEGQPEYVALVAARDDARAEVERVNPAGKPPKKGKK